MNRFLYLLIPFIFLLALFSSSAWCHEQRDIDKKFERGQRLFEAGDLHRAAALLEEVIASQPASQSARSMLFACYRFIGIEYYEQSRCQDAINFWHKAFMIDSLNLEIQRFIKRCDSEIKAIARIDGDTGVVAETVPPSKAVPVALIDSSSKSRSKMSGPEAISVSKRAAAASHRRITCGLSSGIAIGTGDSYHLKTGTTFAGYLSILPDRYWLGARLDGNYSRFYRNSTDITFGPRYLAVSGASVSAVVKSKISRSSFLLYGIGPGVYEIIREETNNSQDSGTIRKSAVLGINLGLGWRKRLGAIAVTMDAKYIRLYSSLSPNLLQISIGIASN